MVKLGGKVKLGAREEIKSEGTGTVFAGIHLTMQLTGESMS